MQLATAPLGTQSLASGGFPIDALLPSSEPHRPLTRPLLSYARPDREARGDVMWLMTVGSFVAAVGQILGGNLGAAVGLVVGMTWAEWSRRAS